MRKSLHRLKPLPANRSLPRAGAPATAERSRLNQLDRELYDQLPPITTCRSAIPAIHLVILGVTHIHGHG